MSTHRLDANLLPWMAQTTPYRGRRANESRLQSYLPLRITSADARRVRSTGDVCQCDSGQHWTVDGRVTPRSRIQAGGGGSTRSTPDLIRCNRRAAADARPAPSRMSRPPPPRGEVPLHPGREPPVYRTVSSPAVESARIGDEQFVPPSDSTESVVRLPSALRKDKRARQGSARQVRVAFVDQAPAAAPAAAPPAAAPIITVAPAPTPETLAQRAGASPAADGSGHYGDVPGYEDDVSITDLLDFDYDDDSDCSSASSQSSVFPRGNDMPARSSGGGGSAMMSRASPGAGAGAHHRHEATPRPASSADGRYRGSSASSSSASRGSRGTLHRQRPHSAMASMTTGNFYVSPVGQPLAAHGRSAGSHGDPCRQQSLVRLQRLSAAPPEPPQLAWMAIASSARLHDRPTSAKPKTPPARSRSPKRRVSSAPPRLARSAATAPVATLDVHDEEEEELAPADACDPAPPSSPARCSSPSSVGDGLDADADDQSEVPPPPLLEVEEADDADDMFVDEGYVGEADAEDAETLAEQPPPSPPAAAAPAAAESIPDLAALARKKSLQKAKFGAKKKQSLTDDIDLLNEYMRSRHRLKSSQTTEEEDNNRPDITLSSKVSPSVQSCRFELPVSMDMLAGMRPSTYLADYTLVIPRRQRWYDQAFNSADAFRKGKLSKQDAEQALAMIHVHAMQPEEIALVMKVVDVGEDYTIERKLFHGLAALSERILAKKMMETGYDIQPRDLIERVDFNNLKFKLQDVKVPRRLKTLFRHIAVN